MAMVPDSGRFYFCTAYETRIIKIEKTNKEQYGIRVDISAFHITDRVVFLIAGIISVIGTIGFGITISELIRPFYLVRYIYPVSVVAWVVLCVVAVGLLAGPPISGFMSWLGSLINWGTEQQPLVMGIVVSVLMGMILTLPISSAALGVILNLSGLAAGAATVGCCCNMIGFAVASFRENKIGGLISQGIGTSMLQVPNIVRHPQIWIPAILSSAILGPLGTMVFHMTNNATGSGMGTAGLVGPLMTWQVMTQTEAEVIVFIKILLIQFVLPAVLTLAVSEFMRKKKWIHFGDMKLD